MPIYDVGCPHTECTGNGPHEVVGKAESSGPTPGKVLRCSNDSRHLFIVYADGSTQVAET